MNTCRHRDPHTALLGVLLVGVALTVGCGDIPGDADDTGSIMKAIVTPYYQEGKDTDQVDVVRGTCKDKDEYYSDHFAKIGFINQALPNSHEETGTSVRVRSYRIKYEAVSPQDAPDLDPVLDPPLMHNVVIPQCKAGTLDCTPTEYDRFTFVDVGKKTEYVSKGGLSFGFCKYNIFYTFYGENDFGEDLTFGSSTSFNIGNYDYCEQK
jgi:hypothetical protein